MAPGDEYDGRHADPVERAPQPSEIAMGNVEAAENVDHDE
jgi:hypothetical protein